MLDEKEQEKPQEEEESYSFLQETIKPKKISRLSGSLCTG